MADPSADEDEAPRSSVAPSYLLEGRFLAVELLGVGEVSEVYKGSDTWSGELVAIRLLRDDRTQGESAFRALCERLFGLSSARVVRPLHYGDDRAGRPFLVTELLVGRGVERIGRVRWEVACEIARQGALALAEMHLNRLCHGDLRPSTLFVSSSSQAGSRVKLLDLGRGDRYATPAKDRAALAAILHALLTGVRPPASDRPTIRVAEAPPELAMDLDVWLDAGDDGPSLAQVAARLLELLDPDGIYGGGRPSQPIPELLVLPKSSVRIDDTDVDEDGDEQSRRGESPTGR